MSYLVLARRYRPQTFDQVIEQEHVTRTLSNAIAANRVAHAFLFAGPRGTGKTTVVRIMAKALNCQEGPLATPCNRCRSCNEITVGNAVDVYEIDGASNNGVDQIRDLRENVKYLPAHSRYKIYIIDEVHMLSIAAFNALLKTLEEPPEHILFMFATTEPHKIPVTILSRCQRHDLRRIPTGAISAHLVSICKQEGVNVPPESLDAMAREAAGSVRDALSLLDQVLSGTTGEVTHKQVLEMVGVVDRQIVLRFSQAILNSDIAQTLITVEKAYRHGQNLKMVYAELLAHFRDEYRLGFRRRRVMRREAADAA